MSVNSVNSVRSVSSVKSKEFFEGLGEKKGFLDKLRHIKSAGSNFVMDKADRYPVITTIACFVICAIGLTLMHYFPAHATMFLTPTVIGGAGGTALGLTHMMGKIKPKWKKHAEKVHSIVLLLLVTSLVGFTGYSTFHSNFLVFFADVTVGSLLVTGALVKCIGTFKRRTKKGKSRVIKDKQRQVDETQNIKRKKNRANIHLD